MRNYHDMGGQPAGPIDREEHELALWEKRVEAILAVLARKGLTRSDEGRRALETLGAERYLDSTYAERRIQACANNMILRGVITVDELAAKLARAMPSHNAGAVPARRVIDDANTRRRTSAGWRIATWSATLAPLLKPMTSARATPSWASSAATSSAELSNRTG